MTILKIIPVLAVSILLLGMGSADQQTKVPPKNIPDFDVEGISFTECQCTAYGCPCRSNGHPTHGACDAADFTFIKKGHYGNVDMSGFKAVAVGDLIDKDASKTSGTVYFDEKTTPAQREAFQEMFASCLAGTRQMS
jgi:hypothetical protein